MAEVDYLVEPIHGQPDDNTPEVTRLVEAFFASEGVEVSPPAPVVVGWRLRLRIDNADIAAHEFDAGEEGFDHARDTGKAWLIEHGADHTTTWFCSSRAGMQRMDWDGDYRMEITRRGF